MATKTLNEIRILGLDLLVKNLGPADAIRFIQSYSPENDEPICNENGEPIFIQTCMRWASYPFVLKQRLKHSFHARFHGSGDYTKERKNWLEKDFDTVVEGILEKRKESIHE